MAGRQGAGLNVGWSLEVDDAQLGLGIEIKPTSRLVIQGNGGRTPQPANSRSRITSSARAKPWMV